MRTRFRRAGGRVLSDTEKTKLTTEALVSELPEEKKEAPMPGGHGGMAGRTAQQARVFGLRSLDGVQGGGADDENAHAVLIEFSLLRRGR